MATFIYNDIAIKIEKVGYGTYSINGYITHNCDLYDNLSAVDEEEQESARKAVYDFYMDHTTTAEIMKNMFIEIGDNTFASLFEYEDDRATFVGSDDDDCGCLTDEVFDYDTFKVTCTGDSQNFTSAHNAIKHLWDVYLMEPAD